MNGSMHTVALAVRRVADGGGASANDNSPVEWTPESVERALLDAFRLDRRAAKIGGPKGYGSAHPSIVYSREEIAEMTQRALDPNRFPLTRDEIRRMESTFAWLAPQEFRAADDRHRMNLLAWFKTEIAGRSHKAWALANDMLPGSLYYSKAKALALITARLNRRHVPVF